MPTDRRDRGEAVTVGGEVPIQLSHPGDEQLHRATPQHIRWLLPMLRWHLQRRDAIDAFAFDPQRLSAGRQHGRARTNAHHRFHQLGRRIDDVLAIVEDQEEPLSSDGPSDGLGGNLVAAELEAEDARDRGRHQIGIGQRGQLDQPSVTPKGREQGAGDLQRQRAFADPTRPGQRDHSIGRQKIQQMLHSSGTADQVERGGREVRCESGRRHDLEDYRVGGSALLPNGPSSEQAVAATKRRL